VAVTRDGLATFGRAAVMLIAGAALWYMIVRWFGWYLAGAIALAGTVDFVWYALRLPQWMRPW